MKLVIVESPKKCDTIGRYLGSDYLVMASQGHIRDLSTRGKGGLGIDVENGFVPNFAITKGKSKIVADLTRAAKKADEVILATDPDREGEAISWHLAQVLGLDVETTKRLQFHEITKPAILEAIENPGLINMDLVNSQETRRMYDRVIGFKLSSLLQKNIGSKSAGRVQSVALKMIVDNDKEIKEFVPEEYWSIEITLDVDGTKVVAQLDKVDGKSVSIHSKDEAETIVARIASSYHVASLTKAKKRTASKPAFTTSTMQQEAYNRFKFSPSDTQAIAQKLYEGLDIGGEHVGLITYIRTDSTRISDNFYHGHAKPYILETFGDEYLGVVKNGKKKETDQDAHEAIRPTGTHRTPEIVAKYVTPREAKLYKLIYDRALASMMSDKVEEVTTVIFEENGLSFKATGSRTLFKGYEAIYGEIEEKTSKLLPAIDEGKTYSKINFKNEQKFTNPPSRYTEARLVKLMEEKGIGRPSTYASTIKLLISRSYITSKSGVLTPTETGTNATLFLEKYFPEIVATDYTAEMEHQLDEIEEGKLAEIDAMNGFYYPFMEKYDDVTGRIRKDPPKTTGDVCPVCGAPLIEKQGRFGSFIACSDYPKCKYVQKAQAPEAKKTGDLCPECGKPLVIRKDKKGKEFVACSGFPSCRYVRNLDGTETPKAKPVSESDYVKPCPKCKKGHLVLKHGKKVDFLGCTNFPKCRYHEWLSEKQK
ncbi:MAG: type I DNA topoisomerase [Bacilli bacterium]|nr:type I DNA topoisomerase [Bacilli bacterium]